MRTFTGRLLRCSLLLAVLGGCHRPPLHPMPDPPDQGTRFIGYRVIHDAPDHLALEVEYTYDGSQGDAVFVGAHTTSDSDAPPYWAYRPDPLLPGTHTARVLVGLNDSAPPSHRTDGLELTMYKGGGPTFHESRIAYPKRWYKKLEGQRCHREWGAGCDG